MDIFPLPILFEFAGKQEYIYPVLLQDHDELILVDCGYPGFMPLIEKAAAIHGLSLGDLTGILITHDDIDHLGALGEIKAVYPHLKVYSSEAEEPYVSGRKKSLRLIQAEDLYESLPDANKPGASAFQEMLRGVRRIPVDVTLGEVFPGMEDVMIIGTPGHTSGHISLYIKSCRTLIAADAVVIEKDGSFEIANPQFTLDLDAAVKSIRKLSQFSMDKIICYHGGAMSEGIVPKLNELVSRYHQNSMKLQ